MIAIIWSALTSKIAGPIASLVAAGLAITLTIVWLADASQISTLHKQADNYSERLISAQSDSAICRGVVADQNKALDALVQKQTAKMDAAEKAIADANANLVKAGQQVSKILAAKPGADMCASADALILGSIQ